MHAGPRTDDALEIIICMGSSCFARGNGDNLERIEAALEACGMTARVGLAGTRCAGNCAEGPNLTINGQRFSRVGPSTLPDILREFMPAGEGGAR